MSKGSNASEERSLARGCSIHSRIVPFMEWLDTVGVRKGGNQGDLGRPHMALRDRL